MFTVSCAPCASAARSASFWRPIRRIFPPTSCGIGLRCEGCMAKPPAWRWPRDRASSLHRPGRAGDRTPTQLGSPPCSPQIPSLIPGSCFAAGADGLFHQCPDAFAIKHGKGIRLSLTKASAPGLILVLVGAALLLPNINDVTTLALAAFLQVLTLPVAANLIAGATYRAKDVPLRIDTVDELRDDEQRSRDPATLVRSDREGARQSRPMERATRSRCCAAPPPVSS